MRMRLVLAAIAAAVCGGGRAAVVEIPIQNYVFGNNNDTVTVSVGDTVRWVNKDPDAHTVTSGPNRVADGKFDSGFMDGGAVFTHTFTAPGTYPYYCDYHVGMESAIEVKAAGKTVTIDIRNFAFGDGNAPVTIDVGDTVEWRNLDDGIVHTVTSGRRTDADRGNLFDHSFTGNAANPTTFSYTFTGEGTYPYHCRPHGNMNSSIIVRSAPAPKRGDVNGDGVVDRADVTDGLRILGGFAPLADGAMPRVDVVPQEGDGAFDVRDLGRILRSVTGTDPGPL